MNIIYLAAHKAHHPNYNITYQDIDGKRDIAGDMLDVDINLYDVIIATPPCNYWSRANYRRETSEYAQATKYLLPAILMKLQNQDKPYIVENVRNKRLFTEYGLYNGKSYVYEHGRHTYWTNVPFNPTNIEQTNDFVAINKKIDNNLWITPKGKIVKSNGVKRVTDNPEGGDNVHRVIEYWLTYINELKGELI